VKKLLVLVALVAACKKDEPKPEPAAEPAAPPAEPEAKPAIDAPEPAGAAAARIAPDVASEKVDKGKAAIGNLKKGLLGALTKALEGGAAGAVETCSVEAPKLAAAQEGVAVGRMTRRTRNPANAVAGWQEEALARVRRAPGGRGPVPGLPRRRRRPGGHLRARREVPGRPRDRLPRRRSSRPRLG
jgi:hypothetical protein